MREFAQFMLILWIYLAGVFVGCPLIGWICARTPLRRLSRPDWPTSDRSYPGYLVTGLLVTLAAFVLFGTIASLIWIATGGAVNG